MTLALAMQEVSVSEPPQVEDFDGFARQFERHERSMREFLASAQDGAYAPLGLQPPAIQALRQMQSPVESDEYDYKIDVDPGMQNRE